MNVMWMSDSFNAPSGFGQQTFHVLSRLTTGENAIHIDNVAWQLFGNPILLNDNWRVLPTAGSFARDILPHHVKIYKPDLLITLADLWNVQYLVNMRREHDFKWMEWLPIDGMPLNQKIKWTTSYHEVDVLVAMSDFGEQELLHGRKAWMEKHDRDAPTAIEKIYHGVPTEYLVPYDEEHRMALRANYEWQDNFYWDTEIRNDFVKGTKDFRDYFVFGVVARNQPRKNYPELIQAWAEFAEMHENVLLWIHAVPQDSAMKVGNLHFFVDQLGCSDSVIFSDSISLWYGKTSKEMADVYNLFDCHFLPTAGEGFGIPTVEAMSCEVFPAVTDFTTGVELLNGGECGYLISGNRLEISPGAVLRAHLLKEEILNALETVYNMSESTRKSKAGKARQRARKMYDASIPARRWRELIDKYMPDAPTPKVKKDLDIKLHFDKSYMMTREVDAQHEYSKNEWRITGKHLEEGETLLEVGAGSGEAMIFLTRHYGVRCIGSDISDEAVKFCRRKGLNVYKHDFNEPLHRHPKDSFDVVFSQHVVEHLDDDVEPIIDSLRVAKRMAVHIVPHDNMRDPSHKRRYTELEVNALAETVILENHTGKEFKVEIRKNYMGDKSEINNLISYVLIFKRCK